jgi:hypothetical protein
VGKSYARVLMMDQGEFEKAILAGRALLDQLAKQEQGEPLCTAAMFDDAFLAKSGLSPDTKLYTTPQQRTWVGLTDEEITDFHIRLTMPKLQIKAIEAKLRNKNGY